MLSRILSFMIITAMILVLAACVAPKGSIVILEESQQTGFSMEFSEWSSQGTCALPLKKDDTVQIDVTKTAGTIALTMSGRGSSEPYTGSNVQSGLFTVTVSESDEYTFILTGKAASGTISVKNLGSRR
ncbi:MAG: hypothetical protein GX979_11190 [Firmicutes bacterium]|nr:hypothetical protein [Bacillota bacterium]